MLRQLGVETALDDQRLTDFLARARLSWARRPIHTEETDLASPCSCNAPGRAASLTTAFGLTASSGQNRWIVTLPQVAVTATDLERIVCRADLVLHGIIGDSPQGSSFAREVEELASEILEGKEPPNPDASFWGLKDPFVEQAEEWIKYLLHVDAPRSGVEQPQVYGAEILLCAEAVRKLLRKIDLKIAPRKRGRIPLVIEELDQMILALRAAGISTPK